MLRTPPLTKTFPSGSKVSLWSLRGPSIGAVYFHEGLALFKSMISAVAVGREPPLYGAFLVPPISSTLPSSYITDVPQLRRPKLLFPAEVQAPVPDTSRYRVA